MPLRIKLDFNLFYVLKGPNLANDAKNLVFEFCVFILNKKH